MMPLYMALSYYIQQPYSCQQAVSNRRLSCASNGISMGEVQVTLVGSTCPQLKVLYSALPFSVSMILSLALEISLGCYCSVYSSISQNFKNFLVLFIEIQLCRQTILLLLASNIEIAPYQRPFKQSSSKFDISIVYIYLITFQKNMQIRILEAENDIYQKEKLLGEGAFGKAYLVKHKQTGQYLVIKEVNIDHMSQKEREQTIKEAQILRNFRHPLIVKFVQVYATKQNKLKIVMEYAECGDLSKAIASRRTSKKYFEENQILDWFTQICLAMKHVHDRKILHRDIKGQNIFITKANTLKLGDFGIARVLNKTQDKARTVVGTPYYLSPQIIENKPYSFKSDVWSMGVLLYELCALQPPFTATSLQFLALKIVKGSYTAITNNYSKDLKGLIEEMLQLDPNRRPSVGEILKKPFLQDRIRKFLSETYRKEEFSHTILHNQKVQISNKLIKFQEDKKLQSERNRLKEEAAMLKQKMNQKRSEQKAREEERLRKKREEDRARQEQKMRRKRLEEQQKRYEDIQRRKEYEQRVKEQEQKRAAEERRLWVERQKRRQQEYQRDQQEQERRRVYQIAQNAKRRERQQQQLYAKKERLLQQKYELEREKEKSEQEMRKKQNKDKQSKKMEEFNQLARKQWYENQMIRKRAEERARQDEVCRYEPTPIVQEEQPRPQSNRVSRNNSRQQKHMEQKKYSMPQQYEPSQQQLQNAMLNPNYKKTPLSANPKKNESKYSTNASQCTNDSRKRQEQRSKNESNARQCSRNEAKKHYDEDRQKMKKDREEFMKQKGLKVPDKTLKPAKWGKSREKSSETPSQKEIPPQPKNSSKKQQSPTKHEDSLMQSNELRLDIKDQEQFNDYLHQLQDLLGNVNKNIQKMEPPLPEIEQVEEEIVVREDGEEFDYSITASFDGPIPKPEEINAENVDLDLFSSYSKLQDLRICLQDKFGTQNFIKIYRTLEEELQKKGLQNFNILQVVKDLGNVPNSHLIAENIPLLLTLIVMEQKMSSV